MDAHRIARPCRQLERVGAAVASKLVDAGLAVVGEPAGLRVDGARPVISVGEEERGRIAVEAVLFLPWFPRGVAGVRDHVAVEEGSQVRGHRPEAPRLEAEGERRIGAEVRGRVVAFQVADPPPVGDSGEEEAGRERGSVKWTALTSS